MKEVAVVLLILAALALALLPNLAHKIAGYKPLGPVEVASLDKGAASDDRETPRFLRERNLITVEVPFDMTVGELLRLYQIDFEHIRRELAEQEGQQTPLADSYSLVAGKSYRLSLTPPAEGSP